ncbi:MAG: hypothetical protein AB7F89_27790 [Pirellulaceae bacterium]
MNDQRELFPSGLSRRLYRQLAECAAAAESRPIEGLLQGAESHLERIRQVSLRSNTVNVRLAEAIVIVVRSVAAEWEQLPASAWPWLRGAIHYFVHSTDEQPDFASPIGFEDDAEVLNACLRVAGWSHWCLKPEDYDSV